MKTINFRTHSGYPMLQMVRNSDKQVEFVATDTPEIGDEMQIPSNGELRIEYVKSVNQSRAPRGNHKNPNAQWHNVSF